MMNGSVRFGSRPVVIGLASLVGASTVMAGSHTVSFAVDPADFDADNDGFITGTEFQPEGSDGVNPDGVVFTIVPTNNLVGGARLLLSEANGLQFGGGGGSTLQFEFNTNQDIDLYSYTLTDSGFILGNPLFDISDTGGVLSAGNDADQVAATLDFNSGPISIQAGETYTFDVTVSGAAIQSFIESWQYKIVPAPGAAGVLGLGLAMTLRRRR